MKPLLAITGLALLTVGCAEQQRTGGYPSLLPRAIETRSEAEPVAANAAAVQEPALDQTLAAQAMAIDEAEAAFPSAAERADARARVAGAGTVGSEAWLDAQTALAELDGYRATISASVTDIEQTAIARAVAGKPPYPAISALQQRAEALLAAQDARIAAIQALIPAG